MNIALRRWIVLLFVGLAANCGAQPDIPPVNFEGIKVTDCAEDIGSVPAHVLDPLSEAARSMGGEITRFAAATGIPPLWCGPLVDSAYRATWLPWNRPVRIVDVRKLSDQWQATTFEFADPRNRVPRMLGRDATVVRRRDAIPVDAATVETLQKRFEIRQSLWSASPWGHSSEVDDGPSWVLELRRGATYKLIIRNGKFDPLIDEALRALFQLAEAPIPDETSIPDPSSY